MRVLTIKELMLLGILASTIHVTVPYRDGRFVREVREGKKPAFSDGLRMAGAPGFEPGNGGIASCGAGTAPADLTVTGLAKALPYSWAEQESSIGFPQ